MHLILRLSTEDSDFGAAGGGLNRPGQTGEGIRLEPERMDMSSSPNRPRQSSLSCGQQQVEDNHPLQPTLASQNDVVQVLNGFQDLMRQFLDTQKSVMQTFLQSYTDTTAPIAVQQSSFPPKNSGAL